jgi:hypothetical protein
VQGAPPEPDDLEEEPEKSRELGDVAPGPFEDHGFAAERARCLGAWLNRA